VKRARLSGIGRPIVWSWPSNRAIALIASAFGGARLGARRGVVWPTAGVFATWALLRELAPKRSAWAPMAAVAVAPLLWRATAAQARDGAVTIGLVMLAARIATRSTGCAPTALDYGALAVAARTLPRRPARRLAAALLAATAAYDAARG
jgi:hypothetical protein